MKYYWMLLLLAPLFAQGIKKDGKIITTFTQEQALEMIKARDAQWEGKIEKSDLLIESQKIVISDSEKLILKIEESAKIETVLSAAKSRQIKLLQSRDKANGKIIKALEPKWYENTYLWLGVGFILGKI
tara:strand:+ start:467 stop:853 length:387 start_codon:yes stop_codon:yes gene_type:complete